MPINFTPTNHCACACSAKNRRVIRNNRFIRINKYTLSCAAFACSVVSLNKLSQPYDLKLYFRFNYSAMKNVFLLFATVIVFSSCGTKEDPYTREQKEIDEYFSSEGLNVYKAFKVSIRGTKTAGQDTAFDNARMRLLALTGYLLKEVSDTTREVDVLAVYNTVAEAKPAIDELLKKDEDTLPTVMQNISFVIQPSVGDDPLGDLVNESEEHLILGGLWFAGLHAHPDLALYEMNRVKSADVRTPQLKCLAEMCRSLMYLTNDWPYHAEKSADDFLALTESQKNALIASPWPAVDANGDPVTPEQAWHQLRAMGFVLRGVARQSCDEKEKKESGLEDYESFISEAKAGGLDHKIVDLVGLMVALEKEDADQATLYVNKLEARTDLTQDEKDLIAEIKPLVSAMKTEDAQEQIQENNLLSDFSVNLFSSQFMNLPVVKKLKSSEAGRKFIGITEIKAEELMPGMDAVDSLKNDAESLMKKVL
jgi:hypothetical protein